MSTDLPDDDDLLAAELAFGLIDSAERQAAEARLGRDRAFAAAHERWQAHAAASFGAGEAPPAGVWKAIERRIPANDVDPMSVRRATLRWWQAGAIAASVAAIVLGVVARQKLETDTVAQQATAPMVAVLTGDKGVVTVSFDPASGRMIVAANGVDVGDRSPELWVIPADGKPRSMGVMNAAAPSWATVPATAASAMAAGATIAVSVEPVGGSPTGQPTGPVILTGKLTTL
jgi:anti-sigma-K factor RskA